MSEATIPVITQVDPDETEPELKPEPNFTEFHLDASYEGDDGEIQTDEFLYYDQDELREGIVELLAEGYPLSDMELTVKHYYRTPTSSYSSDITRYL